MTVAEDAEGSGWTFHHIGLIVTGKGERTFLRSLFRSLEETGHCTFEVIRQIGQRSPISSPKRRIEMVGRGKAIPDKDGSEIGLPARKYLSAKQDSLVVLVDDLEYRRAPQVREVFQRYRDALDAMLTKQGLQNRASVHFFVNMLEAYYFADAAAVNAVLDTELEDCDGDVETIRNPKSELKQLFDGFDEVSHGAEIVRNLDVPRVLSNPATCVSLRTLFAWCAKAIGLEPNDTYCLARGILSPVTKGQVESL